MIVSQETVAEAEIICEQTVPNSSKLDVKYHICVSKEHNVQIDVTPSSSPPIFREVRASESISTDLSPSESVVSCSDAVKDATMDPSAVNFIPTIRSGSHSDIGSRRSMEDEHICIDDLSSHPGSLLNCPMNTAFYALFDGHGGPDAASFIKRNAMRLFFQDADLSQMYDIDSVFYKAFLLADLALANETSISTYCGTTALTVLVLGQNLLVANAGDCRAVLCQKGIALDMSQDHRPSNELERERVERMGGYIDFGYLNGCLGVTRALGDWHLKRPIGSSPLISKPEVQQIVLTEEDEFLIIGCDGIWDVMSSQYAVSLARRALRRHNDPQQCAKELVSEALRLNTSDNLTVIVICFTSLPAFAAPQRRRFRMCSGSEDSRSRLRSSLESN